MSLCVAWRRIGAIGWTGRLQGLLGDSAKAGEVRMMDRETARKIVGFGGMLKKAGEAAESKSKEDGIEEGEAAVFGASAFTFEFVFKLLVAAFPEAGELADGADVPEAVESSKGVRIGGYL